MSELSYIIVDNFYKNPLDVREFALNETYESCHLPRYHSRSFANIEIYNKIQNVIYPFAGRIYNFYIPGEKRKEFIGDPFNGAFNYSIATQTSWFHYDTLYSGDTQESRRHFQWVGVLYLNPNPPKQSGTLIVKYNKDNIQDRDIPFNDRYDRNKWKVIDIIGNVFNRLVLYRSSQCHGANNYFGTDINDGRLIQIFFFSTEK
jgi:hypothetical protein